MSEKTSNEKAKVPNTIQIQIEWDWSTELETLYVNHMRVTHAGPEFYLYFGELAMPGTLFEEGFPEKLTVVPRVRLAIAPEQMEAFISALQGNYEKYLDKKNKE